MKIFDDNFNTLSKSYDSNTNTIANINDNQTFLDFQSPSTYSLDNSSQFELDMDNISDNFERDARRYSRGFETGVIY